MSWVEVCAVDDLIPERGVAALVGGEQVALFLLATGEIYAIGNRDPISGANVMSRGIVGDRSGVPKVASPMYKQSFDLESGTCLDDAEVRVPTFAVRVQRGRVQIKAAR